MPVARTTRLAMGGGCTASVAYLAWLSFSSASRRGYSDRRRPESCVRRCACGAVGDLRYAAGAWDGADHLGFADGHAAVAGRIEELHGDVGGIGNAVVQDRGGNLHLVARLRGGRVEADICFEGDEVGKRRRGHHHGCRRLVVGFGRFDDGLVRVGYDADAPFAALAGRIVHHLRRRASARRRCVRRSRFEPDCSGAAAGDVDELHQDIFGGRAAVVDDRHRQRHRIALHRVRRMDADVAALYNQIGRRLRPDDQRRRRAVIGFVAFRHGIARIDHDAQAVVRRSCPPYRR